MTQREFLKALNLSKEDFNDLLQKYAAFERTLNPAQLNAVQRTLPTISRATRSLGGDVTSDQLLKIVNRIHGDEDGGTFGSKIFTFRQSRKLSTPKG